jgi:hypothetical protein
VIESRLEPKNAVALVPDSIMKAIVESAKVSATLRDIYIRELFEIPISKEYNPSRRDAY